MSATNSKRSIYIEGKDLPPHILTRMNATPENLFQVIPHDEKIDYDDEGNPIPPEECFSDELIKAVEASEKNIKEGNCSTFNTTEELTKHLQKIWND